MESPASLAWRQLVRRKVRLSVAVAGVAFSVLLVLMQLGFRNALFASTVLLHQRLVTDLVLIDPQASFIGNMRAFSRRRLYQAAADPSVASVSPFYIDFCVAGLRNEETHDTRGIHVIGFDLGDRVLDMPEVDAQIESLRVPDAVLFDALSRREYGPVAERFLREGRLTAEVNRRRIAIAGIFHLGTSFAIDGTLITSETNFLRLLPNRSPGLIEHRPHPARGRARTEGSSVTRLAALLPDVVVLTKQGFIDRETRYWAGSHPDRLRLRLRRRSWASWWAAIIVYQILFADVYDHLAEYATLKAMGFTNRYLSGRRHPEGGHPGRARLPPRRSRSRLRSTGSPSDATRLPMQLTPHARPPASSCLTVVMCGVSAFLVALRKAARRRPGGRLLMAAAAGAPRAAPIAAVIAQGVNHHFGAAACADRSSTTSTARDPGRRDRDHDRALGLRQDDAADPDRERCARAAGRQRAGARRELRGAREARASSRVRRQIGYIFQAHNLLDALTALRRTCRWRSAACPAPAPRRAGSAGGDAGRRRPRPTASHRYPEQLSGGQRQRVAIARALVPAARASSSPTSRRPRSTSSPGATVVDLMHDLAKQQGCHRAAGDPRQPHPRHRRPHHPPRGRHACPLRSPRRVTANTRHDGDASPSTNRKGELLRQVAELPSRRFARLLDAGDAASAEQFLRRSSISEDDAFESMLEQVLEAVHPPRSARSLEADRASLVPGRPDARRALARRSPRARRQAARRSGCPSARGIAGHVARTGRSR